ncbi:MAG: glycosyltransferase family 2 protein [Gemmatimonadaceae bacterium]
MNGGPTTVSVIVPAYQRPEALERCLRALARQTRRADEVVVVLRVGDDATIAAAARVASEPSTRLRLESVTTPGVVAAMQRGLDVASGEIIALTDDDAEPRADWLERLVATLQRDDRIVGAGGRDWQSLERGDASDVGRVQWFGRVIGNHHLGAGPARDVDLLKGVNCAFRAAPLRSVGFDARLLGGGAQLHWELALCLPLRRAGWRLVYDPAIAVDHHVAVRSGDDQFHRGRFAVEPFTQAVHNETLVLLAHQQGMARLAYRIWSVLIGTTANPGALAALRLRLQGHSWAADAWRAARDGRARAHATWAATDQRVPLAAPASAAGAAGPSRSDR